MSLGVGFIGRRFGPTENPSVTPSGAVDYSDQYLYWDNPQTATVTLHGVWNSTTSVFEDKSYSNVIVKRVSSAVLASEAGGLQLRTDQAAWLVPIALLGGNEVKDGDEIVVASVTWIVSGEAPLRVVGSSPSHFRCICNKAR